MKEKTKIEVEFRKELEIFLKKHNAEIGLVQRGRAYMEYDVIEITIDAVYDENSNEIEPYLEFDL